jgi:uncharacterized membrane-anchored protein YhcB (DUF1043 family)
VDPLLPVWLIVIASVAAGTLIGILFERTRGPAAKRAAKFEADLVRARSDLMHYQEDTARHFGKSAELLGRMATDYREFLHHFVSGAEEPRRHHEGDQRQQLERPLLDTATSVPPPGDTAPLTRNRWRRICQKSSGLAAASAPCRMRVTCRVEFHVPSGARTKLNEIGR